MVKKASKKNKKKISPHKSFKRSYREDYQRETPVPGIMQHIFTSFQILFKNWKLFLSLLIVVVILDIAFVGVMDQTKTNYDSSAVVFNIIILLIIWLTTIFLLRHLLAGHKVKLRDGLYNAMTPLISTFIVLAVALVQCIPIFLLIVATSAAIQTDFLATPFYSLVFFVFAALMILLSAYLLSSTLIALVAVSAPGLYPMRALAAASELMMGRRIKFILRLIALIIVMVIIWAAIIIPLTLFDTGMKNNFAWASGIPFIPICLTVMSCFTAIYTTTYLYLYYRWILDYEEE